MFYYKGHSMLTTLPSPSAQTIRQSVPDQEDIIRRSLERSARYGVDPHLDGAPESTRLSDEQLRERINGQRVFYTLAKEQIDSLYRLLRDTGFCMALADSEGYVLYVVGDSDLVEHFKRRRCIPGYRWTERDIGTCAIGLSLEERVPVFLPGDRMYSAQARKISNAGAPVFSLDGGRVLGAISLSGGSDMMHIHTLGLVRQAAETVTSQLRERERIRELAIKNQYMRALVESDSRGIVTVDQTGRIVEANSTARKLLKLSPGCEGKSFEESVGESYNITGYLKEGKGFRAREILARRSGTTHFASLDPIRMNSGELVGGLFTVMEKKEMMRMAVEMTGAHAHFTFESILGASESLRSALHLAHIAAGSTAPVLLSGETGTGKELFAQAIHNDGPRRNRPFVAINCGAIPKELLESELFGYEEGAFTGAQKGGRPGKFELADTGTLFLDEIGDMPFDMQVKLLRVLQSGEIQRVGGLRTVPVPPHHLRDQQGSQAGHCAAPVPGGSLLPDQHLEHPRASAPRARRRYPPAGGALHPSARAAPEPASGPLASGDSGGDPPLPVARQYPAVGERRGAGGASGGRRRVVARAFWDCGSHGEPQARRARPGAGDA